MAEMRKAVPLKSIEQLKQELGVSDAVFEGTKAANGWKSGKQVEEQEFRTACEAFRTASTCGSMEDREAKG